jgi:hypothetical protein
MKFTQLALTFQEKVKHMNKHSLVQMAHRAYRSMNVPLLAFTLSEKNVNSLRQLLYRAYVLGMVNVMKFRSLNYDVESVIGTFFDMQPLYYNKLLALEMQPAINTELSTYSRVFGMKVFHGRVVKFTLWAMADEELPDVLPEMPKERVMQLFHQLDATVYAAQEEMEVYKRYSHCLALEKEGKPSTYQMKWKDVWAQKRVAQEEPEYVTLSDPNWSYDTYMVRHQAYTEFERACRMKDAREVKRRLQYYEEPEDPEDVDYRDQDEYDYRE